MGCVLNVPVVALYPKKHNTFHEAFYAVRSLTSFNRDFWSDNGRC